MSTKTYVPVKRMESLLYMKNEEEVVQIMQNCPELITEIPDEYKTEKICLSAVSSSGLVLRHIPRQTQKICEVAINENPEALQYVKKQTPALVRLAVKKDYKMLQYVLNQTYDIVEMALDINPDAIVYVR